MPREPPCCRAPAIASYEHWLADEEADLRELLDLTLRQVADGLGTVEHCAPSPSHGLRELNDGIGTG